MPVLYGHGAFIALGKETTWGTAVSAGIDNRINSVALQQNQERNRKANLSVPTSGMLSELFDGFTMVEGSIELPLYYNGQGLLLEMAFGSSATTGSGAPYTHTYTPDIDLGSATIEVQRGTGITNQMERFVGCKATSLSISCEAGGEMTASVDFIGKSVRTAFDRKSDITSSFGTGLSILHFHAGQLSFNSYSYDVRSMTFTITNNLERRNVLGSKLTAEQAVSDVREVTLEVTLDIETNELHKSFINGVQDDVTISFTSGADQIQFTCTNALITSFSDPVNGFGRVEQSLTFTGLADSSNVGGKIVLINSNASAIAN